MFERRRYSSYLDIAKAMWENKDHPLYSLNILRNGTCDGCALGTVGMRDWTMDRIHLCWIRLNLLRLNTMPPFDSSLLSDVQKLQGASERELRKLGRLSEPMIRARGERAFKPITWEKAITTISGRLREIADPKRVAFYIVSRGTTNETYYVAQKAARLLGTNNVDNSARVCHAPSTAALKQTIGYGATTCSYGDLLGTDWVVFFGSNVANNQPVMMKYIELAKKEGTKVAVVNPFLEPGMQKYWVPSSVDSALFGTKIADTFFQISVGGDIAFINGVLKHLIANGCVDRDFIRNHTTGWDGLESELSSETFEELERFSGTTMEKMLEFAEIYAKARKVVFVWSMGVTMHRFGMDNVKSIVNLALSRGMVGRPKTGLMPIRGHSGVQGGAEMGAVPNQFPGGMNVDEDGVRRFSELWGFEVPGWKGYFVAEMADAAWRGDLDILYCIGSNLFAVLPDSSYIREGLGRIPLRVHHDIVLNPQMLVDPADTVILLPATTRYEMEGGNTETSTERRVIFSPEIPGPRVRDARDEWRVLAEIAASVKPEARDKIQFDSTNEIRREIALAVPFYDGLQGLHKKGDQFQWGGEMLCIGGNFGTPDGRAVFTEVRPPQLDTPEGKFRLTTRRGRQFNSMVFDDNDAQLRTRTRDLITISPADMKKLNLCDGQPIIVRSKIGEFWGRARSGSVSSGSVMMYYPESNVLVGRTNVDPVCGIPAYRDELVEIVPRVML